MDAPLTVSERVVVQILPVVPTRGTAIRILPADPLLPMAPPSVKVTPTRLVMVEIGPERVELLMIQRVEH